MKIISFHEQPLEERCLELSGSRIHSIAFSGEDSVVYRDIKTGDAIHVYHSNIDFSSALRYARCLNEVASSLDAHPYIEEITFQGMRYMVEVRVNPVEEVGEKLFEIGSDKNKRAYTISRFIEAPSLCWPNRNNEKQLPAVASQFNIQFYDRVEEWMESHSGIQGIDINPVNTKFVYYEKERKILLIITDIAKSIGNIEMLNENR